MIVQKQFNTRIVQGTVTAIRSGGSIDFADSQLKTTQLILPGPVSSGEAIPVAPGGDYTIPIPPGYDNTKPLFCSVRADGTLRATLIQVGPVTNKLLIQGIPNPNGNPLGSLPLGQLIFTDLGITSLTLHNPGSSAVNIWYVLFQMPDITQQASYREFA